MSECGATLNTSFAMGKLEVVVRGEKDEGGESGDEGRSRDQDQVLDAKREKHARPGQAWRWPVPCRACNWRVVRLFGRGWAHHQRPLIITASAFHTHTNSLLIYALLPVFLSLSLSLFSSLSCAPPFLSDLSLSIFQYPIHRLSKGPGWTL